MDEGEMTLIGIGGAGIQFLVAALEGGATCSLAAGVDEKEPLDVSAFQSFLELDNKLKLPDAVRDAVRRGYPEFESQLEGERGVVLVCGLGGLTGTFAASELACLLSERGVKTRAVVTLPFLFEGRRREHVADHALRELAYYVDLLVFINASELRLGGRVALAAAMGSLKAMTADVVRVISRREMDEMEVIRKLPDCCHVMSSGGSQVEVGKIEGVHFRSKYGRVLVKNECCSFCGKARDEVSSLIAGLGVWICNECVMRCLDILASADEGR